MKVTLYSKQKHTSKQITVGFTFSAYMIFNAWRLHCISDLLDKAWQLLYYSNKASQLPSFGAVTLILLSAVCLLHNLYVW